jgi:hypothetical protein
MPSLANSITMCFLFLMLSHLTFATISFTEALNTHWIKPGAYALAYTITTFGISFIWCVMYMIPLQGDTGLEKNLRRIIKTLDSPLFNTEFKTYWVYGSLMSGLCAALLWTWCGLYGFNVGINENDTTEPTPIDINIWSNIHILVGIMSFLTFTISINAFHAYVMTIYTDIKKIEINEKLVYVVDYKNSHKKD